MDSQYENNLLDISQSSNPDKNLEFFWLVFKNSINKFIPKQLQLTIQSYSDELNKLQKLEQYNEIKIKITTFMNDNTDVICKFLLLNGKYTDLLHMYTNIHRLKKNDSSFDTSTMLNTTLLLIIATYYKKKYIKVDEIYNLIKEYIGLPEHSNESYNKLEKLFEFGITNKQTMILDNLRNFVDIEKYIKPEFNTSKYKTAKSLNLLKILKY